MKILGIAILIAIAIGFYFRIVEEDIATGDKIIGIAVLSSSFVSLSSNLE